MKLETFADLLAAPKELPYIVDRIIPRDSTGYIYGPPGVGKSFLVMALVHCVGTELPFLGRRVELGKALYIVAEGVAGVPVRAVAWSEAHPNVFLDRVRYIREPVRIDSESVRRELVALLRAENFLPDLVVVDTLSANAQHGFNENDTAHMKMLMDAARALKLEIGGAILFVHHCGRDESRGRGSTDLQGAADVVIRIERVGAHGARLKLEKARDFGWDGDIDITLRPVGNSFVPELVIRRAGELSSFELTALRSLADAGRPMRAKEWQTATGLANGTFFRTRSGLVTGQEHYVATEGQTYLITDRGRVAILSTLAGAPNSQGTPSGSHGSAAPLPHSHTLKGGSGSSGDAVRGNGRAAHLLPEVDDEYDKTERIVMRAQ